MEIRMIDQDCFAISSSPGKYGGFEEKCVVGFIKIKEKIKYFLFDAPSLVVKRRETTRKRTNTHTHTHKQNKNQNKQKNKMNLRAIFTFGLVLSIFMAVSVHCTSMEGSQRSVHKWAVAHGFGTATRNFEQNGWFPNSNFDVFGMMVFQQAAVKVFNHDLDESMSYGALWKAVAELVDEYGYLLTSVGGAAVIRPGYTTAFPTYDGKQV